MLRWNLADSSPESGLFLSAALLAMLLTQGVPQVAEPSASMVLLLGVLVSTIGLPHGGLDAWLAQRRGLVRGWGQIVLFHVLYLLAAITVGVLWWWQPGLALIGFLLISAWHFAGDWPGLPPTWRMLAGVALLGLPAWSWVEPVTGIFGVLAGQEGERLAALIGAGGPLLLSVLACTLWLLRRQPLAAAEVLALAGLALTAPPLLFFAVYFCALHSPRQLRLSLTGVSSAQRRSLLLLAGAYAAVSGLLVLAAGFAIVAVDHTLQVWWAQLDADQGLRMLFIGLAALTVPHMGVAWLVARRREGGP